MARLNGYDERDVLLRHALPNALAPSVQVIALNIQWLVGGIVITEYVFGYPGLGQTLVNAVAARDVPFVQCIALLLAAVYLTLNIVADLLVVLLIPKLRTASVTATTSQRRWIPAAARDQPHMVGSGRIGRSARCDPGGPDRAVLRALRPVGVGWCAVSSLPAASSSLVPTSSAAMCSAGCSGEVAQ